MKNSSKTTMNRMRKRNPKNLTKNMNNNSTMTLSRTIELNNKGLRLVATQGEEKDHKCTIKSQRVANLLK